MKKVFLSAFALLICFLFINFQSSIAVAAAKIGGKNSAARKISKNNREFPASEKTKSDVKKLTYIGRQNQAAVWREVSENSLTTEEKRSVAPDKYLLFQLNKTALTKILAAAPSEFTEKAQGKPVIIELPLPDGTYTRFKIEESSVLEPNLAARFPEIKSYRGQGIDDPTLTTRFDWTPQGFHALILDGGRAINVEPANTGDASLYIAYSGENLRGNYECLVKDIENLQPSPPIELPQIDAPQVAVGTALRNYRLAIATDYEYTQAYGNGTVAQTVSTLNTWVNGANVVYERELAIHLNLVNNTAIIYSADNGYTASTDPYDNTSVTNMLFAGTDDLNSKVGAANYDLGHVMGYLSGGASGVSFVGTACAGGYKGGAATLMGGSPGNSGTLGVWVHELGHEFGASHNFNGTQNYCGGSNHNNATSYESGSGSTIMGYPQICGSDNIAYNRDMRFHAMSYAAINNYLAGTGGTCSINAATGNSAPIVSGGGNHNIPKNTPFTLTATGSDPNGDSLTYAWDQIDAGGANYQQNGTSASYNDAGDPADTTRPIFRPFPATVSPSRIFPSLNYVLNYANDPPDTDANGLQTAEELPRVGRTLNFRVTARDNRTGGGGVNEDTVTLTVDGNSGPFLVTYPNANTNLSGGTAQTVTWSVNNTNAAPVSAANVKISLSTDGGMTFPTVLAASTPNDGSERIVFPNITTSSARIKVEAVGNIFFDINDSNFSITAGSVAQTYEGDVSPRSAPDGFVDASDVQQIRRFVVGSDTPNQTGEFQRADCAPRSTSGDGFIDASDIQQARRYAVGTDSPQLSGGPSSGSAPFQADLSDWTIGSLGGKSVVRSIEQASASAALRMDNQNVAAGQTLTVPIRVDAAGNEAGYSFSIAFDSSVLSDPQVTIGSAGGDVVFNTNNPGQVGFSVTSFDGETIAPGINQTLVNVSFRVAANAAGTTPIYFTDNLARRKASGVDPNEQITQPTYTAGTITIGRAAAGASISGRVLTQNGRGLANARVVISSSAGAAVKTARTNGFGYYSAADIPSGETYIVRVVSKQYVFAARVVSVANNLEGIDFTAQPK